jgi:nucleotide-binding universal stress UspA family protein
MLPIHTILHPTDFSDRSENAFHLACSLARDYGARLVILHVVVPPMVVYGEGVVPPEPDLLLQEANDQLNRLPIPQEGIRTERRFQEGDSVAEILRVAQDINADLIVMGTHGRTGLARLLMGSVAEQVVRQASCPVLTVTAPFALKQPSPMPVAEPVGATA